MDIATSRTRLRKLFTNTVERPSASLFARLGVTPNQLTLMGLGVAGVAAFLAAEGWFLAAGLVLLGSGVFDLLDGALARLTGKVSPFGAVLDSVVDRVGEGGLFLGLLVWYYNDGDRTGVTLAYVAAITSFLVSYARSRAEAVGVQGAIGFAGRSERIIILSIGLMAGVTTVALGIISGLAALTFLHRIYHVWKSTSRPKGS
ncbi:MAG: CDP-alcohol phosphatidyltransferase family protein [Dehalococcoidia bacterium]|nr:CDP-alcohol phosphatidyltransferase family protein [Dehalococcoidia bacterium]